MENTPAMAYSSPVASRNTAPSESTRIHPPAATITWPWRTDREIATVRISETIPATTVAARARCQPSTSVRSVATSGTAISA